MAQDALRGLGDVDGLVADAFEIVVDARSGKDETEVDGHGLLQCDELHDAIVNFDLHFIDGFFFLENARSESFVLLKHGLHGLMNSALRETGHPEQAFLQFIEIVFEVAFHQYSLDTPSRKYATEILAEAAGDVSLRARIGGRGKECSRRLVLNQVTMQKEFGKITDPRGLLYVMGDDDNHAGLLQFKGQLLDLCR